MNSSGFYTVRNATPDEFEQIGKLLVLVYSQLDGFPKQSEQPDYYRLLSNIGEFVNKPETELLAAGITRFRVSAEALIKIFLHQKV